MNNQYHARLRRKGLITKGQMVKYSEEYLKDAPYESLRKAVGRVVKHFGQVPNLPGCIQVDFGPHGVFIGAISAVSPTPVLVHSAARA